MERSSYLGVYCRRWGVPLIDGGTVRLPKIVGQGRALEITLTGRKVMANECEKIGLCEYVVEDEKSRQKAEEIAHSIAKFPQACVKADRNSIIKQSNLSVKEGLEYEWYNSIEVLSKEGIEGAERFSKGHGRHGDFEDIWNMLYFVCKSSIKSNITGKAKLKTKNKLKDIVKNKWRAD